MKEIIVKDFSLTNTLESGQFFRYTRLGDGAFLVNHKDVLFVIKQKKDKLSFSKNVTEKFIKDFFRLDDDLISIYKKISTDPYIIEAINKYWGMRLIRQDPWECLVSYICSSASNIPKIQKNVESLSKYFGRPITCNNYTSYSFPEINTLNDFDKILGSKTGYRAKFLYEVNHLVSTAYFEKLKKEKVYEKAQKTLLKLPGVGKKIADCVMLFSLNHLTSFPADTWIQKVLREQYDVHTNSYDKMRNYAANKWGEHAGYAQQYLYMNARNQKKEYENQKKQRSI
ncbi:hypothetical protein GOV05_01845 [Candidatus Woesearchaeota archaeon]|nr:hypothetical protein [Candidatus Woesearchaeota archaeon]